MAYTEKAMPVGGLTEEKLGLATATTADVLNGKTFYSGDKTLKTGTMIKGATGTFSCSLYAHNGPATVNIGFKPSVLFLYGYNSGLNGYYVVKIVNGMKTILASFRPGTTNNWGDKYTITLTNTGFTVTGTDTAYGESTSFTYVAY